MGTSFGSRCWLGIGEESTYNTPVSPSKFFEIMEESIGSKQNWIAIPTLRNASQSQRTKSTASVEGSFKLNLSYGGHERLLKHALGGMVTTGSGPYTQAFTLQQELPVGLTLHVNRDATNMGTAWVYSGCQIQKLTLSMKPQSILMAEVSIIGSDASQASVATPTFPTFEPIDWTHVSDVEAKAVLDAVTLPGCKEWEITIENNLATDRYGLNSRSRFGLGRNGPRKITGKIRCEVPALTVTPHQYFASLADPISVNLQTSNGLAGANARSLTIAGNAVLNGSDPNTKDSGPYIAEFDLEFYSASSGNTELAITLVNGISSP